MVDLLIQSFSANRKPRHSHEPVVTWQRGLLILLNGLLLAAVGCWIVYQGDTVRLD